MKNSRESNNEIRKNRDWDSTFIPHGITLPEPQRTFARSSECDELIARCPKSSIRRKAGLFKTFLLVHLAIAPKLEAMRKADETFQQIGTLQSHNGQQGNNEEMYGANNSKYYYPHAVGVQDNENLATQNEPFFEGAQKAIVQGANIDLPEKVKVPDSDPEDSAKGKWWESPE